MSDRLFLESIFTNNNVSYSIRENIDIIISIIPEIEFMINFLHKHPHHNLDVFEHTLKVIDNLDSNDLILNFSALLHDIGKPFCYQEGEVRHFHGHNIVSENIARNILKKLEYHNDFIENVCYLVRTHDTLIDTENLDNKREMIIKRLKLQYADALAHHPLKQEKRINILDEVSKKLEYRK